MLHLGSPADGYKVQAKLRNVTDARINVAGYQICILAMFIMRPVIQGTA